MKLFWIVCFLGILGTLLASEMPQTVYLVKPVPKEPGYEGLQLWDQLDVISENQDKYLVEKATGSEKLAQYWIPKKLLLTRKRALQDTTTWIYKKAIVINNLKDPEKIAFPAYVNSDGGAEKTGDVHLFDFYYLMEEENDFYLLSRVPDVYGLQNAFVGWVHKDNLFLWNTRQALELLPKLKERIGLFKKRAEARQFYDPDTKSEIKSQIVPLAEESYEEPWPFNYSRLPLLDQQKDDIGRILYNIGYLEAPFYTQDRLKKIQEAILPVEQQLQQLDVMFVLDVTGSMSYKDYIREAKKAIPVVLDKIRKQFPQSSLYTGFTFYRDFIPNKKYENVLEHRCEDAVLEIIPIAQNVSDSTIEKVLSKYSANAGGDSCESIYYALHWAIKEGQWRKGSIKCMILIGDSGNHKDDGNSTENVSKLKLSDIQQSLRGFHLFALHVVSSQDIVNDLKNSYDESYKLFREQAKALAQNTEGDYLYLGQKDDILTKFNQIGSEQQQKIEKTEAALEELKKLQKEWTELSQKYQTCFIKTLEYRLRELDIEPGKLFRRSRFPLFDTAWLYQEHPTSNEKQARIVILMSQIEMDILLGFLAGILDNLYSETSTRMVWETMLYKNLGEKEQYGIKDKETLDQMVCKRLGLPIKAGILSYSIDELVKLNPRERRKLADKLMPAYEKLVQFNKNEERVKKDGDKIEFIRKEYWWEEPNTHVRFAWIPIEIFP